VSSSNPIKETTLHSAVANSCLAGHRQESWKPTRTPACHRRLTKFLPVDGQPGSYRFIRRIGTDKRACGDRMWIAHHKPTSRYLSARCPTGLLPNRRSTGNSVSCPSQAEKIPHRTEPNAQQDQGNDLRFESLEQEKRQHRPAQRDRIELLENDDS